MLQNENRRRNLNTCILFDITIFKRSEGRVYFFSRDKFFQLDTNLNSPRESFFVFRSLLKMRVRNWETRIRKIHFGATFDTYEVPNLKIGNHFMKMGIIKEARNLNFWNKKQEKNIGEEEKKGWVLEAMRWRM